MKRYLSRALCCALIVGVSCAAMAEPDNAGDAKDAISASDTTFVQDAAADDIAEIHLGQLAAGKSSNDKVKALAQQIIDDHTKANDALKALAESKKVSFPSEMSKDAQKESDKLQAMKGEAFDEAWSKAMVKDHQDAMKLFAKEARQTKDTDIQQFVKTTTPALKSHLDAAQRLVAVPDARDKAMDQATKSMNSAMDNMPAALSTAATPTAKSPSAVATPAPPAATPGAKH